MNIVKHKHSVQLWSAVVVIGVGCALLIAGFIVPPPGEIHNSVLISFGEIMTFAGAVFGLKYHYSSKSETRSEDPD